MNFVVVILALLVFTSLHLFVCNAEKILTGGVESFLSLTSLQSCAINDDISDAMVMSFDAYEEHPRSDMQVHPSVSIMTVEGWEMKSLFSIRLHKEFIDEAGNVRVKVWTSSLDDRQLFVSFRGTVVNSGGFRNVIADIDCAQVQWNDTWVHKGFYETFLGIKVHLDRILNEKAVKTRTKLVFVGHSLGGALATLAAVEYKGQVITFGAPHVGGPSFQKLFEERVASAHRVVNVVDLVPRLLESVNVVSSLTQTLSSSGNMVTEPFVHSPLAAIILDSHFSVGVEIFDVYSNFKSSGDTEKYEFAMQLSQLGIDAHRTESYARNLNSCKSGRVLELVSLGKKLLWRSTDVIVDTANHVVKSSAEGSKAASPSRLLRLVIQNVNSAGVGMLFNAVGHAATNVQMYQLRGDLAEVKSTLVSGFDQSLTRMHMITSQLENLGQQMKSSQKMLEDVMHEMNDKKAMRGVFTHCFQMDETTVKELKKCRDSLKHFAGHIGDYFSRDILRSVSRDSRLELGARFLPLIDILLTGQWYYLTLAGQYQPITFHSLRDRVITEMGSLAGMWIREYHDSTILNSNVGAVKLSIGVQLLTSVPSVEEALHEVFIDAAWHAEHMHQVLNQHRVEPQFDVLLGEFYNVMQKQMSVIRNDMENSLDMMFGLCFGVRGGESLATWAVMQPDSIFFPRPLAVQLFASLDAEKQARVLSTLFVQKAFQQVEPLLKFLLAVNEERRVELNIDGEAIIENVALIPPQGRIKDVFKAMKHMPHQSAIILLLLKMTNPDREVLGSLLFELSGSDVMSEVGRRVCASDFPNATGAINHLVTIVSDHPARENEFFGSMIRECASSSNVEALAHTNLFCTVAQHNMTDWWNNSVLNATVWSVYEAKKMKVDRIGNNLLDVNCPHVSSSLFLEHAKHVLYESGDSLYFYEDKKGKDMELELWPMPIEKNLSGERKQRGGHTARRLFEVGHALGDVFSTLALGYMAHASSNMIEAERLWSSVSMLHLYNISKYHMKGMYWIGNLWNLNKKRKKSFINWEFEKLNDRDIFFVKNARKLVACMQQWQNQQVDVDRLPLMLLSTSSFLEKQGIVFGFFEKCAMTILEESKQQQQQQQQQETSGGYWVWALMGVLCFLMVVGMVVKERRDSEKKRLTEEAAFRAARKKEEAAEATRKKEKAAAIQARRQAEENSRRLLQEAEEAKKEQEKKAVIIQLQHENNLQKKKLEKAKSLRVSHMHAQAVKLQGSAQKVKKDIILFEYQSQKQWRSVPSSERVAWEKNALIKMSEFQRASVHMLREVKLLGEAYIGFSVEVLMDAMEEAALKEDEDLDQIEVVFRPMMEEMKEVFVVNSSAMVHDLHDYSVLREIINDLIHVICLQEQFRQKLEEGVAGWMESESWIPGCNEEVSALIQELNNLQGEILVPNYQALGGGE